MTDYKRIWVTGGMGVLGRALSMIETEFPGREFLYTGSKDCNLTDSQAVLSYVQKQRPDAILHFAAKAGGIGKSMASPATLFRDNLLMNLNVVEAARLCGVKKVVMTLSIGMYPEDAPLPLKEEYIHEGSPHSSNTSYAFAKRMVDPLIRSYRAEYGLNVIGLVPNGIFGEYADYNRERAVMLCSLIRRFHEEKDKCENLLIWGDGSPRREYTYAPDLVRAFMWCLDNYDDEQFVNAGSTEEHSVKEIACMVADFMGIDHSRLFFDTTKPAGIFRRSSDNSRFTGRSGFKYTPFRTGLENTVRWFVKYYGDPSRVRL